TDEGEGSRLVRFAGHVCRRVFFLDLNRSIRLYLNKTLDRSFVFLIGFEPNDTAQCSDVVIDRHQDRVSEVWSGVCPARSSNLVRAVELIVTNADVHIQKTGTINAAGTQGSKRGFNIDAAVLPDRVADEIRFGISLFSQKPKSPH